MGLGFRVQGLGLATQLDLLELVKEQEKAMLTCNPNTAMHAILPNIFSVRPLAAITSYPGLLKAASATSCPGFLKAASAPAATRFARCL